MMKKPLIVIGAAIVLLGLAAMIHPRLKMPAHKTEVEVIGQELVVETQRIIEIPRIWSALVVAAGAGLILVGARKA